MTDIVTYCDVNTCEDCPRYGDDCDGDKRVEHTDLISRADAIEAVRKCVVESELLADWNKAMESAQELLSALPSAEAEEYDDYEHATLVDIKEPLKVEVVRCKDCRHRDLFSCPLADNDFQKDDDYCSWGERREP